jgi:hypothetical protein
MILWAEVGSRTYYEKKCKAPCVPLANRSSSGVTIGVGWDCGHSTVEELHAQWGEYLPPEQLAALERVMGLKGPKAQAALRKLPRIEVPFDTAVRQFFNFTLPEHWRRTCAAFPSVEEAPQCVKDALLSLVFNRGTAMAGDKRREMRAIRSHVGFKLWSSIPAEIRAMKRLWPGIKGLIARRELEARHIEKGLADQTAGA